jgi:3-hydroxybutyryl-CoA dehydrogenase
MAEIQVVGIVGAGQMGRGIAQVAAQSGCTVIVMDASQAALDAGIAKIGQDLGRLVGKGKLSQDASEQAQSRISGTISTEGLSKCDFIVEAATENVELKLKIFESLDKIAKPAAILASNTSSISLTKLAGVTKRPTQVIGMHFMNPVPLMKLVEIVRALQTDQGTYDATCELARRMGKMLVTTKDMPGFIVNRMLIPFINEACFSLQEGLGTVEDIDQGARLGLNHPMGPLELADLIGLDTCLSIAEVLQREFGEDKYRPAAILRNYVAAGWLGRKSGRGFYDYSTTK